MKARLLSWLGLALSAGLLYWIASRFDLAAALGALELADPGWLAAATGVYCVLFVLRGVRWSILLRHLQPIRATTATEVFLIGFMANNVLPARLGDVARAYVLARRERLPAAGTFSSVMLERIFDGLTVVAFLNAVLWLAPPEGSWIQPVAVVATLVFVGALVACVLVAFFEQPTLRLARAVLSPLPDAVGDRVVGIVERLGHGLHALKSGTQTIQVLALSLLIWGIEVSVYVLVGQAFGLSVPVLGMVLVMCVLTLGLAAPSAPGFVGVFEAAIIEAVALYGVAGEAAVAYAVVVHLIHYVPGTVLGLGLAYRSGLSLGALRQAPEQTDAAPPRDATPAPFAGAN